MRITEARMTELAARQTAKARERVARAGEELATGVRVLRPSDDPAAWASAERARLRRASSATRGGAIAVATERAEAGNGALSTIADVLERSRELAIQAANSTVDGAARLAIAQEVRALAGAALNAANATGVDGQFIFAGSQGDVAPFDIAGNYVGDTIDTEIETSPTGRQTVSLNGTALTAASGVNILAELESFAVALEANDLAGVQASIGALDTGVEQVSRARSSLGAMSASLTLAETARQDLELRLAEAIASGVETDSIAAASDLAGAGQSLEVAQAVTEMIINVTRAL